MTAPQGMSADEKSKFAQAEHEARFRLSFLPSGRFPAEQVEADQAIVQAAEHIAALERRNENLSEHYRRLENRLEQVLKFMRSLRQAYAVAQSGVRVGEVEAIGAALRDLQRALGLEPDAEQDGS